MENPNSSHSQTVTSNLRKIKVITGFTLVYAVFWLTNIFSKELFTLLLYVDIGIVSALYIDILNSKLGQLAKAILFGLIPVYNFIKLPSYIMFALCTQFMSLTFGFDEVNWNNMHYLWSTNVLGWVFGYFYFKHGVNNNDSDMLAVDELFRKNGISAYQILCGFLVNYFVLSTIGVNKSMEDKKQQQYEKRLIHLNNELEATNAKLKNTNKELQEALQEKENFILRFSHEIRNPLNSLLGSVELCYEQTSDNKEINGLLHDAKISGEILLQLLNNVLDTAKVAAGRLEVSYSSQKIREFLERSWVICSEIIRKKRLYGCLSLNIDVPEVLEFDHHRMMQILINTISNSAKFTERGHVKMYVDFITGNEIANEDVLPKYFSAHKGDVDLSSGVFGQEEITEKPNSIFEHLTLSNKKFRTDRDVFFKIILEESEVSSSSKGRTGEEGEMEIYSSRKMTVQPPVARSLTRKHTNVPTSGEGYLRFEIVDSGCGMSEKEIEAAFGKFQQVNSSSSKRQIGTGLGLWITKEIIENMKGRIEMYSKPNKGTAVVIIIKTKIIPQLRKKQTMERDQKEGHIATESEEEVKSQGAQSRRSSGPTGLKRALVVEDIPYNQEVNAKLLQKCNVQDIRVANNGREAVDIFLQMDQGYFDLILMDIDMPVMDGKEATKIIRQEEKNRGWTPAHIVFLTGYSELKTQQELLDDQGEYRANGFCSKPASLETFQRIIQTVTSKESVEGSIGYTRQDSNSLVLIADDDSLNLTIMSKMLKLCGYKCLEATNGEEAVRIYNENFKSIKLILMDCEMPVLDGLEATQKILLKQNQLGKILSRRAAVYGLTGFVGANHRQKCLDVGMEDVLEKPITIEKLREILRRD